MFRIEKEKVARFGTAGFITISGLFGCTSGAPAPKLSSQPTSEISRSIILPNPTEESTVTPTIVASTATATVSPSATSEPTIELRIVEPPKESWIYGRPIWQDWRWFPIGPEKARRDGLITLEESLGKYDKLAKLLLGIDSRFQAQYKSFASTYIASFPLTLEWAGFCHGLAHAENLEPQPKTSPETFILPDGEKVTVTYQDRIAFLVAIHSGDAMFRPGGKSLQKNLDILIDGLTKIGQPFVIEAPAPGLPGLWYRGVGGVSEDRNTLMATGFKKNGGLEPIERALVRDAYIAIPRLEVRTWGGDPKLLEPAPDNWDFPLDRPLVNRLTGGY